MLSILLIGASKVRSVRGHCGSSRDRRSTLPARMSFRGIPKTLIKTLSSPVFVCRLCTLHASPALESPHLSNQCATASSDSTCPPHRDLPLRKTLTSLWTSLLPKLAALLEIVRKASTFSQPPGATNRITDTAVVTQRKNLTTIRAKAQARRTSHQNTVSWGPRACGCFLHLNHRWKRKPQQPNCKTSRWRRSQQQQKRRRRPQQQKIQCRSNKQQHNRKTRQSKMGRQQVPHKRQRSTRRR